MKYTKPKQRIVKPKLNYELSDTGVVKDDRERATVNKSALFKTKLAPLDVQHDSVSKSVISNDELVKLSVERSIQAPLFMQSEAPTRDITNPARYKSSVMKVKIPVSHEKFKASIAQNPSELVEMPNEDTRSQYKNKPLHEFDCQDDDKTPDEWLKICNEMNSIAHAHTLVYENLEYFWKPCQVTGQNQETGRQQIKVMNTGLKKEVVRLSLRFLNEDADVFKKRIELCKQLRNHAESEYRLKNQIEIIPQEKVTAMSRPLKARIFNKVVESLPKLEITDHVDQFVKLKRELEKSYIDSQKKFLVETEMKNPNNHHKYESQNIVIKNTNEFVPDFGIIRLNKPQDQDESALLRLDDPERTNIEKRVASLCSDQLDEELLKLDYNKVSIPLTINDFNSVIKENQDKIEYRLAQNWRQKINEELKKQQFEKNAKRNEIQFRMTQEDEEMIEAHIIKMNFFLNNQLRSQMKYLLDAGVKFQAQFSNTKHIQYSDVLTINQMIEDRWLQRHSENKLNDHLEVFRVQKRIEEVKTPLLTVNLVSCVSNELQLESKIVKYMCQQPDLLTIRKSLESQVKYIKELSEKIERIDSNEIMLKDSNKQRLLVLFESEDDYENMRTFPWISSSRIKLSEIIESCMDSLIENLKRYTEFDEIMNIKDGDTYYFFSRFSEQVKIEIHSGMELTEEQTQKQLIAQRAKHSQQQALIEQHESTLQTAESNQKIKRKKSKSDLDKEKRENEKLIWRDEHCVNPSATQLKCEIEKYKNYVARLKEINPIIIDVSMFRIDISELTEKITTKCHGINDEIYKYIHETTDREMTEVAEALHKVQEKLRDVPEEEEKLRGLEDQLENKFTNEMLELEARQDNSKELLTVLEDTGFDQSRETQKKQFAIQGKQCMINNQLSACRRQRIVNKERLSKKLEDEIVTFETKFKKLRDNIESVKTKNNYENQEKLSMQVNEYNEELQKSIKESQILEDRCKFLEFDQRMPPTRDIEKTRDDFSPYVELWKYIQEYHKFCTECLEVIELKHLQKEGMEGKFKEMMIKSQKIRTHFLTLAEETGEELPILEVTEKFFVDLNEFKDKLLPLIVYLGNEAIEPEHWDDIERITGLKIKQTQTQVKPGQQPEDVQIFLKHIQGIDVEQNRGELEEISTKAFKQHRIKKDMEKIESQIKDRELSIVPYGTQFLIKDVDSVVQDLDDKVQSLQNMKNSPDINQKLKQDCVQLGAKIERFSRVLNLWVRVQSSWIYLEPIFGNEDIKEQLRSEATKFEQYNKQWIERMRESNADKKVSTHIDAENLEEVFTAGNITLDEISKGMNIQLNKKRQHFSRFFFLLDETLIEVIARTKTPELIQEQINRLFEHIDSLKFSEGKIVGFYSADQEQVKLNKLIQVEEGEFKGSVEKWLKEFEIRMKKSLKEINLECHNDLIKKQAPQRQWLNTWPAMNCIIVEIQKWSSECESAIQKIPTDKMSFKNYQDAQIEDLDNFTDFARSQLEPSERKKVATILTLKLGQKDVIQFIQDNNINDTDNFQYKSQLRYYQDFSKDTNIKVTLLEFTINYDFDQQGSNTRLVLTPATSRCFRTLIAAKCLNFANSLEGPSGCGKTETVKDLARTVGYQCLLFNSTQFMTEDTVGKIFRGIAGTGAWAVFDEFDRFAIESMSIVSMMLFELIEAMRGKKNTIVFYGSEGTRVIDSMCVTLTMRAQAAKVDLLPDNLRYQVRQCTLKTPDYQVIAKSMLYIRGFGDQENLGNKICNVLDQSRRILSDSKQNNFGLRMLITIINWTNDLKVGLNLNENVACHKALQDCILPRMAGIDNTGFKDILKDMFLGEAVPDSRMHDIEAALSEVISAQGFVPTDKILDKTQQLHEMHSNHRSLILLGCPGIGKSSILRMYKDVIRHNSNQNPVEVDISYVNPKAVDNKFVMGYQDERSESNKYGIIPKICKQWLVNKGTMKWIVADGPLDVSWTEDFNTVLDDNMKLTLYTGEYIRLNQNIKIIFETDILDNCSPDLVSRSGIILLESKTFTFKNAFTQQIEDLKNQISEFGNFKLEDDKIKSFVDAILQLMIPITQWIEKHCAEVINTNRQVMTAQFFKLLKLLLNEKWDQIKDIKQDEENAPPFDVVKMETDLRTIILTAIVYSQGSEFDNEQRNSMTKFINEMVNSKSNVNDKQKLQIEEDWVQDEKICEKMTCLDNQFDHQLDFEEMKMVEMEKRQFEPTQYSNSHNELQVQNKDTYVINYYLSLFQKYNQNVLITGPQCTGKTKILKNETKYLTSLNEKTASYQIDFFKFMKASQLQFLFEGKLNQRIRARTYGPSESNWVIMLLDDIHMPQSDQQGVKAPIELLRQLLDQGGWYDTRVNELVFKLQSNLTIVGTCQEEKKASLSLRQKRHQSVLRMNEMTGGQRVNLQNCLINSVFDACEYNSEVKMLKNNVVESVMKIVDEMQNFLKPKPNTPHQIFSSREVWNIIECLSLSNKESIYDDVSLCKLWVHETCRLIKDKLVTADNETFEKLLTENLRDKFGKELQNLNSASGSLIFGGILAQAPKEDEKREQTELYDLNVVKNACDIKLNEYNNKFSEAKIDIVLFDQALSKICIISRILNLNFGHGILQGKLGLGKNSLLALSAHICNQQSAEVVLANGPDYIERWYGLLQSFVNNAGFGTKMMIKINLKHLHNSIVLDNMSNLLNSNEVSGLFDKLTVKLTDSPLQQPLGREEIINRMQDHYKNRNMLPHEAWDKFKLNVGLNLHFMIVEYDDDRFRKLVRDYPSIESNTNIVLWQEWPENSQDDIASIKFKDLSIDKNKKEEIVTICKEIHFSSTKLAERVYEDTKFKSQITAKNYLDLLEQYIVQLKSMSEMVAVNLNMYENGLKNLEKVEYEVVQLETKNAELTPQLEQNKSQVNSEKEKIDQALEELQLKENKVNDKKSAVDKQKNEIENDKQNIESELQKVEPIVKDTHAKIRRVDDQSFTATFNQNTSNQKVVDCMELFLEIYKIKNPRITYEVETKVERGVKVNVKSIHRTVKNLSKQVKFKDEMLEFNFSDLKQQPDVFEQVTPKFKELLKDQITSQGNAITAIQDFMQACITQFEVDFELEKARKAAKEKEDDLDDLNVELEELKKLYEKQNETVEVLKESVEIKEAKMKELEHLLELYSNRLERASHLTEGLKQDKNNWIQYSKSYEQRKKNLQGDTLLYCAIMAYLSPFNKAYRDSEMKSWIGILKQNLLETSSDLRLINMISEPKIQNDWIKSELPNDDFSLDNAVIMLKSDRQTLAIDPNLQASNFLRKKIDIVDGKKPVRLSANCLNYEVEVKNVRMALKMGQCIYMENFQEPINPLIKPLVMNNTQKKGNATMVLIDGEEIEVNKDFALYLQCSNPRPNFSLQIWLNLRLINFSATTVGLYELLRNKCIEFSGEKKVQDHQVNQEKEVSEHTIEKQKSEIKILQELSNKSIELLDNQKLLDSLEESEKYQNLIRKSEQSAKVTKKRQEELKKIFDKVSEKVSHLFFVLDKLWMINPLYVYSLDWYRELFVSNVKKLNKEKDKIESEFKESLQESVSVSMFEKDRLILSLLISLKMMELDKFIDPNMSRLLIKGGTKTESAANQPEQAANSKWLSKNVWAKLVEVSSTIENLAGQHNKFAMSLNTYDDIFEDPKCITRTFPGISDLQDKKEKKQIKEMRENMSKLLIIRICKPEQFRQSAQYVVQKFFDWGGDTSKVNEQMPFNLKSIYGLSKPHFPVLFIMGPGTDPMSEFVKFSKEYNNLSDENVVKKSLGLEQTRTCENALTNARMKGQWIIFQNCHLSMPFLQVFETRIAETLAIAKGNENKKKKKEEEDEEEENENDKIRIDPKFRMWATTKPTEDFPSFIAMNSIKVVCETPQSIKSHLVKNYNLIEKNYFNDYDDEKMVWIKKLIYGTALMHSAFFHRTNQNPLGFNKDYKFSNSDFEMSKELLKLLVNCSSEAPIDMLSKILSEIIQGGKMSDERDEFLVEELVSDQINESQIRESDYKICGCQNLPENLYSLEDWRNQLCTLDTVHENAKLIGLDPTSDVLFNNQNSVNFITQFELLELKVQDNNDANMSNVEYSCNKQIQQLPEDFVIADLNKLKPIHRDNSLNFTLHLDVQRYNNLLNIIKTELNLVKKSILGLHTFDDNVLQTFNHILHNRIPDHWEVKTGIKASAETLSGLFLDLQHRLKQIQRWLYEQQPIVFWLPMFANPKAFLSALLQNYARQSNNPVDNYEIRFTFSDVEPSDRASKGEWISGIVIEHAVLESGSFEIQDCSSSKLIHDMPYIKAAPVLISETREQNGQSCPLYKAHHRHGVLQASGHTSNQIDSVLLKIKEDSRNGPGQQARKGVAMFLDSVQMNKQK